jgi:hypothetical protein
MSYLCPLSLSSLSAGKACLCLFAFTVERCIIAPSRQSRKHLGSSSFATMNLNLSVSYRHCANQLRTGGLLQEQDNTKTQVLTHLATTPLMVDRFHTLLLGWRRRTRETRAAQYPLSSPTSASAGCRPSALARPALHISVLSSQDPKSKTGERQWNQRISPPRRITRKTTAYNTWQIVVPGPEWPEQG